MRLRRVALPVPAPIPGLGVVQGIGGHPLVLGAVPPAYRGTQ
jgi:hypothetical protein